MGRRISGRFFAAVLAVTLAPLAARAGCERPVAGSVVAEPPGLHSQDGVLDVALDYQTSTDAAGRTLYCFVTAGGAESPTLHVNPGDTLNITLRNRLPALPAGSPSMTMDSNVCGAPTMNGNSVNMHFHGTNVSPQCHSDEVIYTSVNSGETFVYSVHFPTNEPPGLYWYHPHIHGISEPAVQGGGTGAIVVDGLENLQPAVAGLPARIMEIRDLIVPGDTTPGGRIPSWDISLNYVPIAYPAMTPAVIEIAPGRRELWRVVNSSADTIADIVLRYDDALQPLEVVGFDGVPTNSQDGTRRGSIVVKRHILLPPAGRAEFIVTGPSSHVHHAVFETLNINTGPDGDNDPTRVLAVLRVKAGTAAGSAARAMAAMPAATQTPDQQRFEGVSNAPVTARRKLYFSEVLTDPSDPASPTNFYITVDGATPMLYSMGIPPAIVTQQGAVEEWTIENRAQENHEFHIHQIHFLLQQRNGETLPVEQQQFFDTVQVPYWTGTGPYPSITVKLDFRGDITGDFVYHCHILGHEDGGMMAMLRVLPRSSSGGPP